MAISEAARITLTPTSLPQGGLQQNHRLRLNLGRACCTAAQARNTEALVGVRPLFDDTDGADANSNARFEITRVKADG
ncbi:hypothetical protein VDS41_19265 [Xanthomonas campestris pv. campestris]|nr:hypothetical protein [Xanthomonas campestris pv. campestris]